MRPGADHPTPDEFRNLAAPGCKASEAADGQIASAS